MSRSAPGRRRKASGRPVTTMEDLAILEVIPEPVVIVDANGRILYVNPAGSELLGYAREKLAQVNLLDPVPPEQHAAARRHAARCRDGRDRRYRLRLRRQDGAVLDVLISTAPLADSSGEATRRLQVLRDVSEQQRPEQALRESEQRLRNIYHALEHVALVTTDLSGAETIITGFSPGAERMFGYRREEIIGKPLALLHPRSSKPCVNAGRTSGSRPGWYERGGGSSRRC